MRASRRAVLASWILTAGLSSAQTPTPTQAPQGAPPRQGCTDPKSREFDFWLGQWDVLAPKGQFAGVSRITLIDRGCVLHESWASGPGGYVGQSLNSVGPDGKWHQTWVDTTGARLDLAGGLVGGSMVMEGDAPQPDPSKPPLRNRITWTPMSPILVRQHWESSTDLGKTWTTSFDGQYHRIGEKTLASDSFMNKLQGGWIGTGQLMKRDSHVELEVEPTLGRPLFKLNWRNVVTSDPRVLFEGMAMYEDLGQGSLNAMWWDNGGAKHSIQAAANETSMTSLWGANGKTVYTLLPKGGLEVVDSTKAKDGTWSEFGKATLRRK